MFSNIYQNIIKSNYRCLKTFVKIKNKSDYRI